MDNVIQGNKKALKSFMKHHFCFSTFKKVGIYPKDLKHNDYEGQAKIICHRNGLESIYDYGKHEIRCHVSYACERPLTVDKDGKLKTTPFVETIFPNQLHI